jgi:hypothetical protein
MREEFMKTGFFDKNYLLKFIKFLTA